MDTPHNTAIEKMMIGLCLVDRKVSWEAKQLSVFDFFGTKSQRIWAAICEMDEDGEPIDLMPLFERVKTYDITVPELTSCSFGIPAQLSVEREVKILKDLAALRAINRGLVNVQTMIGSGADTKTVVGNLEQLIEIAKDAQVNDGGTSKALRDVLHDDLFPRIDRYVNDEMVKVPFGIDRLDRATNGGAGLGELIIFGAKSKAGKSAWMTQIARQQAEMGVGCYVCSREMLNYENAQRMLSQTSPYTANHFRRGLYAETASRMKSHAQDTLEKLPIWCDDKAKDVKGIKQELARIEGHGKRVTSVFVDYIQLLRGKKVNRAEDLEEIIYDLKDLALEQEKIVYVNAQFNREGAGSDRPKMSDFKGSSGIEMAGNLILLWTIEQDIRDGARHGTMWIEAGRSVAYDEFPIQFYGESAMFVVG